MIWTWCKDSWLVTRGAANLFLIATVAVIALTAVLFFGKTNTNAMSLAAMRATLEGVLTPSAFARMIPMAERFERGVAATIAGAKLPR